MTRDLTTLAHRLNMLRDERESIAFRLLQGVRTMKLQEVQQLKARYTEVAQAIARLERRLT